MEEIFSMKSLSDSFENDVLRKNEAVMSWSGGNGVWIVKIGCNFHAFREYLLLYAESIAYMHFKRIELLSNPASEIIVELV